MPEMRSATPPASFEARLPCPVCLGVQMDKVRFGKHPSYLTLDHCTRCGGVWFEKGEARRLSLFPPSALAQHIPPLASIPKPPCHGCHAPLDRDVESCDACGTLNVLPCPACSRSMDRRRHGDLFLDACASCKGVWFDHAELRSVWTLALDRSRGVTRHRGRDAFATGGDVLLESLFWAPDLTLHAGAAVVQGVGSALGSVSLEGAAHLAGGAAEVAGSAAEHLFGFVLEIIAGIFDGT